MSKLALSPVVWARAAASSKTSRRRTLAAILLSGPSRLERVQVQLRRSYQTNTGATQVITVSDKTGRFVNQSIYNLYFYKTIKSKS